MDSSTGLISNSFDIIDRAFLISLAAHGTQMRKHDGKTPFIVHPVGVALIVAQHTKEPEIIAAALLHDTVEDTLYTAAQLRKDFGPKVADIVAEITEAPRSIPWRERKLMYIKKIETASFNARLISCADKMNNVSSLIAAYRIHGEGMWKKFNSDKTLWYYEEVYKIFELDHQLDVLTQSYRAILNEAHMLFGS